MLALAAGAAAPFGPNRETSRGPIRKNNRRHRCRATLEKASALDLFPKPGEDAQTRLANCSDMATQEGSAWGAPRATRTRVLSSGVIVRISNHPAD